MKGKTVAILEARLGSQLADLIARQGGRPLQAPALAEEPDVDEAFIAGFVEGLQRKPAKLAIFQTGVGTRALFEATDRLNLTAAFCSALERMVVVARGPKPAGPLRSRGVRIDVNVGEPFTTEEVLQAVANVPLQGARVIVQRYGSHNEKLDRALEERGGEVTEIPTYRWSLPRDTAPLVRLIDALARGEVAATVFTNAAQVGNLFKVAQQSGKAASLGADLNRSLVASIGPVCSAALAERGVRIDLEPHPPKLGALVTALAERLSR